MSPLLTRAEARASPLPSASLWESSRNWLMSLPSTFIGGPIKPSGTRRGDPAFSMKLQLFACLAACFVGAWVPVVHAQGIVLSYTYLAPVLGYCFLFSLVLLHLLNFPCILYPLNSSVSLRRLGIGRLPGITGAGRVEMKVSPATSTEIPDFHSEVLPLQDPRGLGAAGTRVGFQLRKNAHTARNACRFPSSAWLGM